MILPILLGTLALVLGALSAVLALLVGRRYHRINIANRKTLGEFESRVSSSDQLHRSHTRRLQNLDAEFAMCRSQIAQLNSTTGGFWRTGIGTLLQIRQMSDNHIEQAMAHLEERGDASNDTMRMFRDEQRRRRHDRRMTPMTL